MDFLTCCARRALTTARTASDQTEKGPFMHPDRFSFLAYKHKQFRAVVARDVRTDGTSCTLECGHVSVIAPHFDVSKTEQLGCYECGKTYVRSAPQYAKEFQESA